MNRCQMGMGAITVAAVLVAAGIVMNSAEGQMEAEAPRTVGRYQVTMAIHSGGPHAILCDTSTGQMWRLWGDDWRPMKSPVHVPR